MSSSIDTLDITRGCPYHPAPEHVALQQKSPVSEVLLPNGRRTWILTRHADIRAMLSDTRFSSDRTLPKFPFPDPVEAPLPPSLIGVDPPQHTATRRAVVGEFTVRRVAAMRPRIQEITDEHIAAMRAGPKPVDLGQSLSLPVPSLVISELLGVPYEDHDFFQSRTKLIAAVNTPPAHLVRAAGELVGYITDLVERQIANPGDDVLGRQVLRQRQAGKVDAQALAALAFQLLIAGHETTANMISLGVFALLERPDDVAAMRNDPTLTPGVVEELLRFFTIADLVSPRVATADVEIGGVLIRNGEGVLGLANTGNRDPEVFDDPNELNIRRTERQHLSFSYGPHQCLGQNLARAELQIVFDTLFRAIPDLRLAAPVDELAFKTDAVIFGMDSLPVTW